jgi:hypothetical protein
MIADFTDADLIEMATDHLLAMLDGFPDSSALAWARLEEHYQNDLLAQMADVASTHGVGDQAALEYSARAIVLTAERDGAKLKGMTGVAGVLLGLIAPGSREDVRTVLKGMS